ncbi:MAG: hypothetical protein Q8N43_02300, partial [Candidatus Azambacteria bacterium]|nr:hypothetical protein [Candidatus Azambacteria bacterium]
MAEPIQKPEEDIIVRTMKSDLAVPVPNVPVPTLPSVETKSPLTPISQEATYKAPQAPTTPVIPSLPPLPKIEPKPAPIPIPSGPPILVVPPKTIPPKEIPGMPVKPLYKVTPVWIKLGIIGLAIIFIALSGLYGYWKIFIQSKLPTTVNPLTSTTTMPTLPIASTATTTAPIKFFNKLPNKSVTIDLPSKTPTVLIQALKSEAKIEETRASIKQIKITYQGKPLTTEEFFNLMSIFAPKDFLSNYENEFVLAYFSQKEGARPILILKIKDKKLAQNQMADWEKMTLASDIFPLFLNDSELPKTSPSFKSYLFTGQPVRYLNINMPFASLNYAIYNNFLIFTASSAGMFVILQDLTGQIVSQ